MFTASQCLIKAAELEARAAGPNPLDVRDEFLALAIQWHRLAVRARVQDQRAPGLEPLDPGPSARS
jgi:hypothetical protein